MKHPSFRTGLPLIALILGPAAPAPGASPPPLQGYTIQSIATLGDTIGGIRTRAGGRLEVDGLNDNGQLVLLADNAAGGSALLQSTNGTFSPIVVGGGDAPSGNWPQDVLIDAPVSMNQLGNIVFTASFPAGGHASGGMYRWDYPTQKVIAVGLSGMTAGSAGSLLDFSSPTINNGNEIAFVGGVQNEAMLGQSGVFLLGPDGELLSLAPPGQKLPFSEAGDFQETSYSGISLNDAGVAAFTADVDQLGGTAYVWEKGTITPLFRDIHRSILGVVYGRAAAWVNNQNRAVLVATTGDPSFGVSIVRGLYRWTDGTRTPVIAANQATPDGGRLADFGGFTISAPNEAGQHVVVATLRDGTAAAYLLDASGKLSLILQSGMATGLGPITRIGRLGGGATPNRLTSYGYTYDTNLIPGSGGGVALNGQGQVALTVQINGGPDTVVLLTPNKP